MVTRHAAIVLVAVVAAGASGVGAQVAPEPPLSRPVLMGAGLGVVGFFAGGLTATYLARNCTANELCGLEAAFFGAAAGGTVGLALGTHLGNARRGSLPLDLATGAVVWGVGIAATVAGNNDDEARVWIGFVTIPIAQLASTVAVERGIGRARARRVRMSVVPGRDGGIVFLGRVALH